MLVYNNDIMDEPPINRSDVYISPERRNDYNNIIRYLEKISISCESGIKTYTVLNRPLLLQGYINQLDYSLIGTPKLSYVNFIQDYLPDGLTEPWDSKYDMRLRIAAAVFRCHPNLTTIELTLDTDPTYMHFWDPILVGCPHVTTFWANVRVIVPHSKGYSAVYARHFGIHNIAVRIYYALLRRIRQARQSIVTHHVQPFVPRDIAYLVSEYVY